MPFGKTLSLIMALFFLSGSILYAQTPSDSPAEAPLPVSLPAAETQAEPIEVALPEAGSTPEPKANILSRQKLEQEVSLKKEGGEVLPLEIDSYFRYMPSVSVEAMPGEVGLIDTATEYSYEFKVFDKLPLQVFFQHRYIGIDDSVGVTLPAKLTQLAAGIQTTLPFFNIDKTYLRFRISPAYNSDDWTFHSSSFRIPVFSMLIYQPDDKWTFIAGVAVAPDFQNPVWPIAGFIYKPNERLTFNIVPERPTISYALNDKLTVFGEGDFSYSEFEVNKDELKGAVLEYQEIYLGGGLEYQFNKFVQASVSVGNTFGRRLKYSDSQGKVNIKDGLYTEFRIEARI